jgi:hypothetical protein
MLVQLALYLLQWYFPWLLFQYLMRPIKLFYILYSLSYVDFCKFRCCSRRLPLETGKCPELKDYVIFATLLSEFHDIMSWNYQIQEQYLPIYCCNNVNTFRFNQLFSVCNSRVKVMVRVKVINTTFNNIPVIS